MSKILVIEDDPGLMESYKVGLGHAGFTVLTALDGETGLETAKSAKPDLIVLDQILPKMPGVEVLELLKKDPQTATIPVINCFKRRYARATYRTRARWRSSIYT